MAQRVEVTGNLGQDPEVRVTPNGRTVCGFSVAHQDRRKNQQGEWEDVGDTVWFRVSVWGDKGERAAEVLNKGDRVHVIGKVSVRAYEGSDGPRASLELTAYDVFLVPKPHQARGPRTQPQEAAPAAAWGQTGGTTYQDTPGDWGGASEPPF